MLDDAVYTLSYFHKDCVTSCNEIEKDCDNLKKDCDKWKKDVI